MALLMGNVWDEDMTGRKKARDGNRVYQTLRNSILRLETRPGAIIDEASIAAKHSVSRTPIREAIIQLISEGLIVRDGRVARAASFDFDEVPRLFDAIIITSRMIHRLAAENRTDQDLEKIKERHRKFEALVSQGDGVQRQDANLAFHMSIAAAARNRYFAEFYEHLLYAFSRLSRAAFSSDEETQIYGVVLNEELLAHLSETVRQHAQIVDAIAARDIEEADRLAIAHQDLAAARLKQRLFGGSRSIRSKPALAIQTSAR
ncbi:GntR family transcriptional regulator [Mesorhizobium amorphae]|uniref:GntR family transcriptional regulator n=1 Tax=Mesorhizobium amorphae TaxID=71433 RepID=UPI001784DC1D|nr:GntR family transcriptional regulator [Mesorhizobium amorphae]